MAGVRSKTLAVGGPPRAHNLIFGDGKNEVAVAVEADLVEGPFLAFQSVYRGRAIFVDTRKTKRRGSTHMSREQDRPHFNTLRHVRKE